MPTPNTHNKLTLPKALAPKALPHLRSQGTFPGLAAAKMRSLAAMSKGYKARPKSA